MLKHTAAAHLAISKHYPRLISIDASVPSPHFCKLTTDLTCKQASLLVQLCTVLFRMTWTWGHAQASASINTNVGRSQFKGSGQGGIKKKISSKPLWLSSARYVRRTQRKGNNGLYIRKTDNKKNYFFLWTWELGVDTLWGGRGHVSRVIDLGHRWLCPIHYTRLYCWNLGCKLSQLV